MQQMPHVLVGFKGQWDSLYQEEKVAMKGITTAALIGSIVMSLFSVLGNNSTAEAVPAGHAICTDCHLRGDNLKIKDINDLCSTCHPENINDHKLGVIPKSLPKGLPLDKEQRVTCVTCHEPHGKDTKAQLLRLEHNSLCIACHPV
jgi:predicted CXXCH cytochrome family protein